MSKQIIKAHPEEQRVMPMDVSMYDILNVSEFFFDTIQGEGINIGKPAAFLRLQDCTLNCVWCDTTEVWREGNPYTHRELMEKIAAVGLDSKLLRGGQHLVVTGGSPLKQQRQLIRFFEEFQSYFGFTPYVEIENECVLRPLPQLKQYIACWNNSPKLSNSGNSNIARYKPAIIHETASLENSWFKFVISDETDWEEIQSDFIDACLISKKQIILMPEGADRNELILNQQMAVDMAVTHNVRYCSREHIILWDKKTGV
jgi:7-carboxy-7-deazaguanine synthase